MSETTPHGENIANEILGEDAYGSSDDLTVADVWNILDNLQTSFMEQYERKNIKPSTDDMVHRIGVWMRQLEDIDEDLPL
jgi:hypothetical protein